MRERSLLVLLLLAGCVHARPLRFGPQGEIHDPALLLRLLDQRGARLEALSADGRVTAHGPSGGGATGVSVSARRPASIRFELDSFFGNPLLVLATDGTRMQIWDLDHGVFQEGPADAAALAALVSVPMSPADAVSLLLGDPPRLVPEQAVLSIDRERGAYLLELRRGGLSQRLWVEPETLDPIESAVAGPAGYVASFSSFETTGGERLPREIDLVAASGARLRLRFRELRPTVPKEPDPFELTPPPNVRVVPLGG